MPILKITAPIFLEIGILNSVFYHFSGTIYDVITFLICIVKNNSCLFERLFRVKKNGVFLFRISFFVLEIFTLMYYANEESDDVIDRSTKTIKY